MIDTYEVTITHPMLTGPLVMDVPASSARVAESRARLTAMHMYRTMDFMDTELTQVAVELLHEGVQA